MRFWLRELMGWLLLAVGLYLFYVCFTLFLAARIVAWSSAYTILTGRRTAV